MRLILFAFVLLAIPSIVSAHTTGASWTATSTEYVVDVGYDPVVFEAGTSARFDFLLWEGAVNTGTPIEYDSVWVRLIRGRETILATGVGRQSLGPTTLLYVFESPGQHKLEVSYRDAEGETLARSEFDFDVSASRMTLREYVPLAGAAVSGVVLGALGVFLMRRRATSTP